MLAELHPRLPSAIERTALWLGRRRRSAFAIAIVTCAAIASAVVIARIGADVPLFDAELHPTQIQEVENALTLWGERFRASSQGTQVFVASTRRRSLLLRLALAGLPHRYIPTSADILDDQGNALTPQSVIDDRRRSGIEGDLVAGLRRIAGVSDAAVVLPPPSDDAFTAGAERAPPSAAVQLVMKPGEQLSGDAVSGIKRFVASAFPGLTPDRVTVVDGTGVLQGPSAPADRAGAKERRVQVAVQSALDDVLGAGAAVVRVSVRTSGIEQRMQSTRVVPHGELSAEIGRERGADAGKTLEKEHSVRRFAYDTLSESRTTPADAQVRMSVAVFLDPSRVDVRADGAIQSLVRAAAGADFRSGDDVVVESVPFAPHPSPPAVAAAVPPSVNRALVPAVVVVAVALFGLASLPRAPERRERPSVPAVREILPQPVDPRAAQALASIAQESPQAAAYVVGRLAPEIRNDVLALCTLERRFAIESYIVVDGSA